MAIEKEAQTRKEPGTAKQFEVGISSLKIKGRKHGKRLVEFFEASTVVEKEQAVDEGSLASGNQDMIGSPFGLKETMRGEKHRTWRNDPVVGDAVEDHIFAEAAGEIVDGLKGLIGKSMEFERRMEGDDGVVPERGGDTIPIQGNCGEGTGVDAVRYLQHAALFFETLEEVQKGAVAVILVIALTCLFESEEGRGLGELGKRQTHDAFSYRTYIAYLS